MTKEQEQKPLKLWIGVLQGGTYLVHIWAHTAGEAAVYVNQRHEGAFEDQEEAKKFRFSKTDFRELHPNAGGGSFHFI